MKTMSALIFGHNEYATEIAKSIVGTYKDITIYRHNEDMKEIELQGVVVEDFDVNDNFDRLVDKYNLNKFTAFCVLEDEAENIFLTISLRSTFKDLTIIALSKTKESANKLTMAGANKVIPIVETTASIISNMLKKPLVTEILHTILYEKSELKVAQVEITDDSCFDGQFPSDIEWSRDHGIVVLSVAHQNMESNFIYSSKAKHQIIQKGDIFVIVGYEENIKMFKRKVKIC